MTETWSSGGDGDPVTPDEAVGLLRERIAHGEPETWLTSSAGRSLVLVSNTERVMVMLLDDADDPGRHAVDPSAPGVSGGYVLSNGQVDVYPDADTVPLAEALRIVRHVVDHGTAPPDAAWADDR
ncbi:hypothetical protein [Streptomyces sp. NPDC001652]|uniref:hypothetical protein n=1 Tax=Streptomyces sp. NPDC001652 TaxID=3154393 RepID=UPI00332741C9